MPGASTNLLRAIWIVYAATQHSAENALVFTTNESLALPVLAQVGQRNAFFDAWFYDVTSLSAAERALLNPLTHREGTLVVVPPSDSYEAIRCYRSVADLIANEHAAIRAVAVSGVGSSVLGTAALARNVADGSQGNCIGVVSGYGAADMLSEALGGWFFYGAADAAKHMMKSAIEFPRRIADDRLRAAKAASKPAIRHPLGSRVGGSDASSVIALLSNLSSIDLVVGHSKGALLLDFALEHIASKWDAETADLANRLRIVTLGAVVDLPRAFRRRHQMIGGVDWFGGMNSRSDVPHERIPGAWHHLNRQLPMHLDVPALLRERLPAISAH